VPHSIAPSPTEATPGDEGLIVLVGLPGSGKSTVGRSLAKRLRLPFWDSDHVIEERLGCSIREFFEREGDARFRDVEHEVLTQLLSPGEARVISTGGGAVLREANRLLLRSGPKVVYLHSTPDELWRRLRHDTQRPLLQVTDPQARLRQLFAERDPLYREVADFVIETGRPSVPTLVNMVVMQLELAGLLPPR
jgi:shikimate kinase